MGSDKNEQITEISIFVILACVWSWVFWAPRVLVTFGVLVLSPAFDALLAVVGAFGPAAAALYTVRRANGAGSIGQFLRQGLSLRFSPILIVPALVIMPLVGLITGGVLSLTGVDEPFSADNRLLHYIDLPLALVLVTLALSAVGQEIGWRGFLQRRLQSFLNPLRASLLIGVIWGVWQLPLHFVWITVQTVMPVFEILLQSLALSILFTWLFNKTGGSTLIAVLFHFMVNASALYFPIWANPTARWVYLILIVLSIFGLGMAVGFFNYQKKMKKS